MNYVFSSCPACHKWIQYIQYFEYFAYFFWPFILCEILGKQEKQGITFPDFWLCERNTMNIPPRLHPKLYLLEHIINGKSVSISSGELYRAASQTVGSVLPSRHCPARKIPLTIQSGVINHSQPWASPVWRCFVGGPTLPRCGRNKDL